jgi:hypothetical protein
MRPEAKRPFSWYVVWTWIEGILTIGQLGFLLVLSGVGFAFRKPLLDFSRIENVALVSIVGTMGLAGLVDILLKCYTARRRRIVQSLRNPPEIASALKGELDSVRQEILSTHLAALPVRDDVILARVRQSHESSEPIALRRIVAVQSEDDLNLVRKTPALRTSSSVASVQVRVINAEGKEQLCLKDLPLSILWCSTGSGPFWRSHPEPRTALRVSSSRTLRP